MPLSIPRINIDNCVNEIKNKYHIQEDLIIAIESKQDKILYLSIYDPNTTKKIYYDEICENTPAIIEEDLINKIPDINSFIFLMEQGIDLSDKNSDFYMDLCFHFKSPDGKDIPLKERIKLFFPNVSLCKEGCSFKGINKATNKSKCECKLNDLIDNDIIEGNKFLQNTMAEFKTLMQKTNIEVLRCYKDLFKGEFYISNHGSFIILGLLIIQIILTIIYYKKYIFAMRKYLFNLTQNYLSYLSSKGIDINTDNSLMQLDNKLLLKYNKALNINNNNRNNKKSNKNIKYNKKSFDKLLTSKTKQINLKNRKNSDDFLMITNKLNINMEEYIQTEPNEMEYDDAIRRDKRTFCLFFNEKLKDDLFLINIFCNYEHLNPRPIKLLLFIMNIDLIFFVNGLFFTEEHLDEIYQLKNYNFLNIIDRFTDRILYIILIDMIINYISDFFFYEERIIKKIFKREKENILILKYEMAQITKNIKSRYNLFIIICLTVALFVWYYVFCFNNIYPSMKIEWIITSVIIIFLMQVCDFLKLLLQACVRFISLKCKSEKLFKLSLFLS